MSEQPCHICGSVNFRWQRFGSLEEYGMVTRRRTGIVDSILSARDHKRIEMRECQSCHNIQLFLFDGKNAPVK